MLPHLHREGEHTCLCLFRDFGRLRTVVSIAALGQRSDEIGSRNLPHLVKCVRHQGTTSTSLEVLVLGLISPRARGRRGAFLTYPLCACSPRPKLISRWDAHERAMNLSIGRTTK